jgi:hypothetical protein
MRLVGATISDYKSINQAELPLERLTVLFGANGAGKTNIIEALGIHDPLARAVLRRDGGDDRYRRARVGIVAQLDVTREGDGAEADLLLEMLSTPWDSEMDMDEVSQYLGAYCGATWWMNGGNLRDPSSRTTLTAAYAAITTAILADVPGHRSADAHELLGLLLEQPHLLIQEDFAVSLTSDRNTPTGRRIIELAHRMTDVNGGPLGHDLGVLRSWTGRWPPLMVLSCGPGAEPSDVDEPLVPAGFGWLSDHLGSVHVVSGDVSTIERHLDGALVAVHDRLFHRPVPDDDDTDLSGWADYWCEHCIQPDHGGHVDPDMYRTTFGPYRSPGEWLESRDDAWIRVRPSLQTALSVIEDDANERLPAFVSQQGRLRLKIRPVPEWESAPARCRITFDLDAGDPDAEPASWDGPVGVLDYADRVDTTVRSVPLADLGAGIRRWVATAVRLAVDACESGEITAVLTIDLDPTTPIADAYDIEAVSSTPNPRPRILLVDEPEQHLHPAAQQQIIAWSVQQARQHHAVVVSTHSPAFFALPPHQADICEVRRVGHATRVRPLRPVHGPEAVQRARELGFDLGLGRDALAQLTRAIAVVEGDWDLRLLQRYFGSELSEQRVLVVPLQGSDDFGTLANAAVIPALGVPVVALLDEVRAASPADLATLTPPLSKAERTLRDLAGALGDTLRVVRYPDPDVICALPEDAVRTAYPALVFPGWRPLLDQWRSTGETTPFKRWALAELGVPRSDRKPPTGFFRRVLHHDQGGEPTPNFRAAAKQLLAEIS